MRSLSCPLVFLFGIAAVGPSFAAQDAAVEVQEGNVEHWIEYYKKERDGSNRTVTKEPAEPAPQSSGTGATTPVERSEQTPASESVDR